MNGLVARRLAGAGLLALGAAFMPAQGAGPVPILDPASAFPYDFAEDSLGRWVTSNPAASLYATAGVDGISVTPSDPILGSFSFSLSLSTFGRADSQSPVVSGSFVYLDKQIINDRSVVSEWLLSEAAGLEHGFTVPTPPVGGKGPLMVTVGVAGDLLGYKTDDFSGVEFRDATGRLKLVYGELSAFDANGKQLKSWFDVSPGMVSILVDDTGAVYPVTIDPLITSSVVKIDGATKDALFGHAASPCDDLTGDAQGNNRARDFVVGAPGIDLDGTPSTGEGKVFIYRGTGTSLSATPPVTIQLNSTLGPGANFGASVACGDFDGDGDADILIGAPGLSHGESQEGALFVVFGPITGTTTVIIQNPPPVGAPYSSPFEINLAEARLGSSVAAPGNVHGDPTDDILAGAPGWAGTGMVFVFDGGLSGGVLNTSADWSHPGSQAGEGYGHIVAGIEDFDADGIQDILVTAPGWDGATLPDLRNAGRADFFKGPVGSSSPVSLYFPDTDAGFGTSASAIGDVNGDGYADIAVGAPYISLNATRDGGVLIWHGRSGAPSAIPDKVIPGGVANGLFGWSIGALGDINKDLIADVGIGSRFSVYDPAAYRQYEGRVSVFQGQAPGDCGHTPGGLSSTPGQVLTPGLTTVETTNFGSLVVTANDLTGDGASEIVVAAERFDLPDTSNLNNRDKGRLFLFRGDAGFVPLSPTQHLEDTSGGSSAAFGSSVAIAGDLNGDAYRDLVVGAPAYVVSGQERGRIMVFYGTATGYPATPSWTYTCNVPGVCNQIGSKFGASVASAGDVNNDGISDIVVGAPDANSSAGQAFVFLGSSACGLYHPVTCTAGFATPWITSGTSAARYGASVSSAGDPNGDGCSDVLVGAWNDSSGLGKAFLYLGCTLGGSLSTTPNWTSGGTTSGGRFGWSVASAGDVNKDGWSDVIIGEPFFTGTESAEGRALVYHGRGPGQPTALTSAPVWTFSPGDDGVHFGWSVASAGDLDANGASDVIIGAPDFSGLQTGEGNAHVFLGTEVTGLATAEPLGWPVAGGRAQAHSGLFVGSVGDVSGDTISDIFVGSPQDPPGAKLGRASIYVGSGTGPSALSYWSKEWTETTTNSPSFGSSAAAVDVDGDHFFDLFVGVPGANRVAGFEVNPPCVTCICHPHVKMSPRARQLAWNGAGIQILMNNKPPSSPSDSFKMRLDASSPAGRTKIKLEWEVKDFGVPFSPEQTTMTGLIDTGAVAGGHSIHAFEQHVSTTLGPKKWRVRILSTRPLFPDSRWYYVADNAKDEADVLVAAP